MIFENFDVTDRRQVVDLSAQSTEIDRPSFS